MSAHGVEPLVPQASGWYGKLPSRGDFVGRGLPRAWQRVWDDWLQRGLASAVDELGAAVVRERLTTMPPWHCVVLPGAAAAPVWCGIVAASADRIGRSFPLLLAEAYDAAAIDAAHVAQIHARAEQLRDWLHEASATASPKELDAGLAAMAATSWAAVPAAATSGETLAALRGACPDAASFWWCAAPAALMMPPLAEPWPPRERLVFDWLGEGD